MPEPAEWHTALCIDAVMDTLALQRTILTMHEMHQCAVSGTGPPTPVKGVLRLPCCVQFSRALQLSVSLRRTCKSLEAPAWVS